LLLLPLFHQMIIIEFHCKSWSDLKLHTVVLNEYTVVFRVPTESNRGFVFSVDNFLEEMAFLSVHVLLLARLAVDIRSIKLHLVNLVRIPK
jgi:hypothetical protein